MWCTEVKGCLTCLCSDFENIFEVYASVCEFVLQHHDDVVIMLINLFSLCRLGTTLSIVSFEGRLQSGNLSVYVGYVLLDDVGQFLSEWMNIGNTECTKRTRTLISTGRSSNNVFRFATRPGRESVTVGGHQRTTYGARAFQA